MEEKEEEEHNNRLGKREGVTTTGIASVDIGLCTADWLVEGKNENNSSACIRTLQCIVECVFRRDAIRFFSCFFFLLPLFCSQSSTP